MEANANSNYTERSYKISQLILVLLTFAALSIIININAELSRYLFGLPVVFSGILGIYGSYIIYKGLDEPTNEKKIIAITVNFAMVLLTLTILVSNTLYRL
ncbi:hypothetical protein [Muriicola sp. Z0-33]|uniref:hypothetical protein n=1 Tax=Muriicola sp. Z0-33 TaxID=2816957 RepID=UPI002238CB07|nr:hypothetical protein [Muriicola sp. Z0-33]MCW5515402.1 hypothetical protein [Muriicola sp. Z0-33]